MDVKSASEFVSSVWTATVEPKLCEYISIPNQSPLFDPEWATNGLQEKVAHLFDDWVESQKVPGLTHKIIEEAGRTPLLFIEVEGTIEGQSKEDQKNNTVLLYGHMDKQPPLTADWDEGLHPYTPVYRDGKLYGRGGADDGYAVFSAVTAINSLKQQGLPHARCVIIIEACEESGSRDLPYYIDKLADEIGTPSLIVCLDSGCGNYDQLWLTSSLRGILVGNLKVRILKEGVHSGKASGIVPSSFRILRQVLSRIEDPETGKMLVPVLDGPGIPESRITQAHQVAETLGQTLIDEYPFWPGARSVEGSLAELLLNKTWRPTLEVTGVAGIPPLNEAGNVLRSYTEVKLSIRLPPNAKSEDIIPVLKEVLEKDPPYGAEVVFTAEKASAGWDSPQLAPWLEGAINKASDQVFGKPACIMGEGGSIPFMGMLGEKFPKAQFVITGVLGPNSNAHGPNEFIEIQTSKNVTTCVGYILHEHSKQPLA